MTIVDKKTREERTNRVMSISANPASRFPDYAIELEAALSSPVVDLEQVTRIIGTVPELGAQLLIFANSELAGLSRCVSHIPEAVVLLGTERSRALVLGYAVMQEIAASRPCPTIRNMRRGSKRSSPLAQPDMSLMLERWDV
jgi:HD-like signal output (HDOD) protein